MSAWSTHPVTPDRFEDFADVINPNRRVTHCWCTSHRLRTKDIEELGGPGALEDGVRERAMRALCERDIPPGVVTYLDGIPVGWCNIGPRADIPRLAGSKLIRPVDDVPVWSIVCVVVRGPSGRGLEVVVLGLDAFGGEQHLAEHLVDPVEDGAGAAEMRIRHLAHLTAFSARLPIISSRS